MADDKAPVAASLLFEPDPYRHVVFPNRIREQRMAHGHPKLMAFAAHVPDIPYIRLSKIERGEVFARADELARIGAALGIEARELLVDVDAADFDIATWFAPFAEAVASDDEEESRFALMLAAAVRRHRALDPTLTAAEVDRRFDIAPVILSRIENAYKGLSRWNGDIVRSLARMFDVADEAALRRKIAVDFAAGHLAAYAEGIVDAETRRRRTSQRIAALAADLRRAPLLPPLTPRAGTEATVLPGAPLRPRLVKVMGMPADAPGALLLTPLGEVAEAPTIAGRRSFGVRVTRATLGLGLPGRATLIVDPDRYPQAGGLALVRVGEVHRVLAVVVGRDGSLIGCSTHPEFELAIDSLAAADVAAVVSAHFV